MSVTKNCHNCLQRVGKMENGKWVFYKELGINHIITEKKIYAHIDYCCQDCLNIKYHKWKCILCNKHYTKEDEFCDSNGYKSCVQCLNEKIIITKCRFNCDCMVCINIEENLYLNS